MPNGQHLPVASLRPARYRESVTDRHAAGSWLSGRIPPPDRGASGDSAPGGSASGHGASGPGASGQAEPYPGLRFGLPEHGAWSVAGIGRRLGALLIDWLLCTAIALSVLHQQHWTIVIFAVEVYLPTATTGFTVGKRLLGTRVVRLDGKPVGFGWALLRVVLLLAVVPPLVFDKDLRGLHDRAAKTVVIRI
jgi:RDD family